MELSYEMRKDHLRVVVAGAFQPERARIELANVIRRSVDTGLTRILVDARGITDTVPVSDRYELARQLADHAQARLRLAVVVEAMNRQTQTFEDTARNRGVAVRTTTSMPEALAFLGLEQEPGA